MRWYLLALVFLLPSTISAQSLQSLSGGAEAVSLSITPDYPAPYGEAFLSVTSSTLNLAASSMRVRIPLAGAGVLQEVDVEITTGGETISKTISVQPEDVVIVAEPLSTTPPLYPGRPLIPLGGTVRLVALANLRTNSGAVVDPTTASYRWSINGAYRANSSGIGRSSILLTSPLKYRSATVSVVVTSPSGDLVGGDSFTFFAQEPTLRTYEKDALLGVRFGRALPSKYAITGAEATLFAGAFSFPTQSPLSLEWFVDGASVHAGNSITLRPSGSGKGNSSLSLVAGTGDSAKTSLGMSLSFDTKSSNLFGL
jgi:hypothetical protein